MISTPSWLDHGSAASKRSMRMLSFFTEREARDELGIGGIRNAIAGQLFPGTSTIQIRRPYVFLILWLYAQLEKNTSSSGYSSGLFALRGLRTQSSDRQLQAFLLPLARE